MERLRDQGGMMLDLWRDFQFNPKLITITKRAEYSQGGQVTFPAVALISH